MRNKNIPSNNLYEGAFLAMINHISIAVHNPKKVADVIAELWDGIVVPFPPAPDSF